MSKTASQIVDRALTLIDEVPTTFATATAATTETSIRQQALEILPELCRDLIKELPWDLKRHLADTATLVRDPLIGGEDQSGYIKQKAAFLAPSDFWELVAIRLTVWAKPVTEYIYINDKNYPKQNNPFTRAGKQNPIVAINNISADSDARIECFSVDDETMIVLDSVAFFEYVAFGNVPDDEGNNWPDELFLIVTKTLASELNIIKNRLNEAAIKGEEVKNAIEQHK